LRGAGTWIGRWRDPESGQRRYEALGAADDHLEADADQVLSFAQAQERAREFFKRMARAAAGDFQPGDRYTVVRCLADYFKAREERGDKSVEDDRRKAVALIEPTLGAVEVAKLTKKRVARWLADLAAAAPRIRSAKGEPQRFRSSSDPRARRATANRILGILKGALNRAYEEGRVPHDEAWRTVKAFKAASASRVRILTDDEMRRLLNASAPDFRELATAAFCTGARYSELARLVVEDFNADTGTVHIRFSKAGYERHVVLTEEGQRYFAKLARGRLPGDRLLLRENGKIWKRGNQQGPMAEACEAAKIKRLGFHQLRHCHASRLIRGGAHLSVIAEQLGHRSIAMVERHYGHLTEGFVSETIRSTFAPLGIVEADNVEDFHPKGSG
jgi:integrase